MGVTDDGVNEVYDGLQRITCLTILFATIRDRLEKKNPKWSDWLHFFIEEKDHGYRLNYPQSSERDTGTARWMREFVQTRGETLKKRHRIESRNPRGRVSRAVREFNRLTSTLSQQDMAHFARFLMTNVSVVVIEIADPRLASQAFVTTNTRGVPLSAVDILKGRIMDIAGDERLAFKAKAMWDGIRQTPDLEGFMSAVDFIERRTQQGPSHLLDLAEHLARNYEREKIIAWLQRVEKLANGWKVLKTALADPQRDPFKGNVWRLGLLHWNEWRPLALYFLYIFQTAKETGDQRRVNAIHKRFELFHRRAFAISLAGLGTKARSTIFGRALDQSEGVNRSKRVINCMSATNGALRLKPQQKERAEAQLSSGFEDRESRAATVSWLESLHWNEEDLPAYLSRSTVEHILPQTPSPDAEQWRVDFPDADERLSLTDMLGNLILVEKEVNQQAGNRDFLKKVKAYKAGKLYHVMADEVAQKRFWRREEIVNRTLELRDMARAELRWDEARPRAKLIINSLEEMSETASTAPEHQ